MANIIAIVTMNEKKVGGGAPIFYTANKEELQKVSHLLEKVTDCAAHEVSEELFVIIDRSKESS